jgi:hypothetical protein
MAIWNWTNTPVFDYMFSRLHGRRRNFLAVYDTTLNIFSKMPLWPTLRFIARIGIINWIWGERRGADGSVGCRLLGRFLLESPWFWRSLGPLVLALPGPGLFTCFPCLLSLLKFTHNIFIVPIDHRVTLFMMSIINVHRHFIILTPLWILATDERLYLKIPFLTFKYCIVYRTNCNSFVMYCSVFSLKNLIWLRLLGLLLAWLWCLLGLWGCWYPIGLWGCWYPIGISIWFSKWRSFWIWSIVGWSFFTHSFLIY